MAKILGFIGLGVMGRPMARHLAEKLPPAIDELLVYDIDPGKAQALREDLSPAAAPRVRLTSLEEIGTQGDIIFLSLPGSKVVRDIVLGGSSEGGAPAPEERALGKLLKPGSIIADTSTTEVQTVKDISQAAQREGFYFLDTPISGGEKAAQEGRLSFMAGGDEGAFEKLKPYCLTMGASAVYLGESGAGQSAKAVNQMIVGAAFAAIAESFSLGVRSGLDPKTLYQAIKGGWAGSAVLDVAAQDMFSRAFAPGGTVDIHWKDLGYALTLARDTDSPVPLTALVHEIFKAARAKGEGQKSQSAVVRLWEDLLGIEVT
ncbi:MAG: NAD(P)-binding domain-containing protein [Treponema sp.]|nr:NAD(P)-binding domain-containing protein [Treponema sp.]